MARASTVDGEVAAVRSLLEQLSAALPERGEVELSNLRLDLQALLLRLGSGEYAQTDFEVRSVFDVQRRTREYLAYFAGWQAQARRWAALLSWVGLEGVREVIDVCPGWAPKIELALNLLHYQGRVRLLDRDAEASSQLCRFLCLLAPPFQVEAVAADLFELDLPITGELVLANHVLDDLVLDQWARSAGVSAARLYEDEVALRRAWLSLLEGRAALTRDLPPRFAGALARLVAPNGHLVLAQYPGHVERLLGTSEVSELFAVLLQATRGALLGLGFQELPFDDARARAVLDPATLDASSRAAELHQGTVVVFRRPTSGSER